MSFSDKVIALIVSHDSASVLPSCLEALNAEGIPAMLVDNKSEDESLHIAQTLGAKTYASAKNEGFGRGMNLAAREAVKHFPKAEYFLLTNPDLRFEPEAVARMLAVMEAMPDVGLTAPRIIEHDGRVFFQAKSLLSRVLPNPKGILYLPEGDCCTAFLSGAAMLVRRELFETLGGFDPNIFLFYEDDDLCRRIMDAGFSLIYVHDAVAWHGRGKSSSPKAGRHYKVRWHLAWSKLYAARKYGLPHGAAITLLQNMPKWLIAALTFNTRLKERYGGTIAGTIAGLRGVSALKKEELE